jgi:hypothetical protein
MTKLEDTFRTVNDLRAGAKAGEPNIFDLFSASVFLFLLKMQKVQIPKSAQLLNSIYLNVYMRPV